MVGGGLALTRGGDHDPERRDRLGVGAVDGHAAPGGAWRHGGPVHRVGPRYRPGEPEGLDTPATCGSVRPLTRCSTYAAAADFRMSLTSAGGRRTRVTEAGKWMRPSRWRQRAHSPWPVTS